MIVAFELLIDKSLIIDEWTAMEAIVSFLHVKVTHGDTVCPFCFHTMNIFRLVADMLHLVSILILLLKIMATRSASGIFSLVFNHRNFFQNSILVCYSV